jgi:hypothetical protein
LTGPEIFYRQDESNGKQDGHKAGKIWYDITHFLLLISLRRIVKQRIEGTHNPMKMAASFSPVNHRYSEKIRDKKADDNMSISEAENFLSIIKALEFY